jgi:tetratricopeptide (TPR) repeat protein
MSVERPRQKLAWFCSVTLLACLADAPLARTQSVTPTIQSTIEVLRAHDYARALEMAQALAREHPDDARVWTLQGSALSALGRGEESLRSYQQALRIGPNYLPALEGAAQCEYAAGSPAAQNLLDRIIRIDPANETAHAMLASLSFKQNQCDKAVAHFALARKAISSNPPALAEYGICLAHGHQLGAAEPIFRRLFDLQPHDWHNRYNIGLIQYMTGRNTAAVETLKPIVDGPAAQVDALNLIAAAYEANHETPAATEALRRAIDLAPRDVRNYLDLATLCMDHAAFQVGVDIASVGLKQIPDSAALYAERAVLNAQLMKYDAADADFAKANQLEPRQEFATVGLGISLLERNDSERSLKVLRSRLRESPDEPTLNYLIAEVLTRRGAAPGTPEFKEAKAAAQRAVKAKVDFAPAHDVLSRLYLRAGDAAQAVGESRLALKFDPTDRTALFHLISALRASGDKSEVATLTARLRDLAAAETRNDAERSRFRIVEAEPANSGP